MGKKNIFTFSYNIKQCISMVVTVDEGLVRHRVSTWQHTVSVSESLCGIGFTFILSMSLRGRH